ncbi:MAG: RHS repeat-associated core domain-containing protein [Acidobacteriota bacterium]
MRHRGLAFILALLLSAPAWGARAPRPDAKPETFEPGTGKYILVLKDPRTDTDDPATGKKKAKEPNVVKHGGKVLHKKEGLRIIKLPTKEAKLLRLEENVAYLQRVWLGEPLDTWGEDDLTPRTNIEADAAVRALDNDLTWTTGQYLYDGSGNIKQIGNDTYRYDTNGRLAQAVVRGVTETYQYDAFGNLTQKSINGAAGAIAVDPSSNRLKGEAYDAAGNLTTRAGVPRYDYDSLSMIDTVIKPALSQTQRIIYGPNDERIGVILEEGVLSRWKIRDFNGKVLREFRADDQYSVWQWMEDYVYVEGRLLAAERDPFFGGKRHFHTDHLGSVRMITDQNRMRISTHDFLPFGVEQTDATQEYNLYAGVWSSGDFRSEPMKFTGHERDWHGWLNVDNDDSLDYMHARYYDPNLGRFLSVDPGGFYPERPQSWNRYAYVENNPVKNIDTDGRECLGCQAQDRDIRDFGAGRISVSEFNARGQARGVGAGLGLLALGAGYVAAEAGPVLAQLGTALAVRFPSVVIAVQNFLSSETGTPTIGGFNAASTAIGKAETTGAKFGMTGDQLVKTTVATGGKFVDQAHGTINSFMARPDGKSGFVRVTMDAANKVVSVGLVTAANVRNGIKEGRFILYAY